MIHCIVLLLWLQLSIETKIYIKNISHLSTVGLTTYMDTFRRNLPCKLSSYCTEYLLKYMSHIADIQSCGQLTSVIHMIKNCVTFGCLTTEQN
jgi:hypothetical protein